MALALSSSLKPLCSFSSSTTSPSSTQQDSFSYRPAVILPAKPQFLSVSLYSHFMHCTPLLVNLTVSVCVMCMILNSLQGLGNNSSDYLKLEATLKENYGVPTVVAKVSRLDWLRNAAGLVDPNYWRGTLRPRPVLDWFFLFFFSIGFLSFSFSFFFFLIKQRLICLW